MPSWKSWKPPCEGCRIGVCWTPMDAIAIDAVRPIANGLDRGNNPRNLSSHWAPSLTSRRRTGRFESGKEPVGWNGTAFHVSGNGSKQSCSVSTLHTMVAVASR